MRSKRFPYIYSYNLLFRAVIIELKNSKNTERRVNGFYMK